MKMSQYFKEYIKKKGFKAQSKYVTTIIRFKKLIFSFIVISAIICTLFLVKHANIGNTISDDMEKLRKVYFVEGNMYEDIIYEPADLEETADTFGGDTLPECVMRLVGNMSVNVNKTNIKYLDDDLYPMVKLGGHYKPRDCRSRHKVAIMVPIRNREDNLRVFLNNIHPFLMRQKLEYRIFVIEQSDKEKVFNKGRLYNAGFREIQMLGDYQCIVFHDVDLLPTDHRIVYSCPILPRHMCPYVIEMTIYETYSTLFGGVTAMTMGQYRIVNGYSNIYWLWGGEDDDLFMRLQASGLGVTRYKKEIARYTMLEHPKSRRNRRRLDLLKTAVGRMPTDGLSNLKYSKISCTVQRLYTRILIDINPTRDPVRFPL